MIRFGVHRDDGTLGCRIECQRLLAGGLLRECLIVNGGLHLRELEQVFAVVTGLRVIEGGSREPKVAAQVWT